MWHMYVSLIKKSVSPKKYKGGACTVSDIIFYCGACGAKLSAGPDESGEEFECPSCGGMQCVPGERVDEPAEVEVPQKAIIKPKTSSTSSDSNGGSGRVVRIPKKKIVISTNQSSDDEQDDHYDDVEDEIDDEVAGTGLRVAAMALGTTGILVAVCSLVWVVFSGKNSEMSMKDWGILILMFSSTFMVGLMGFVISQIAFRVERTMAYARYIATEE